jgi:putative oxidoreductase
MQPNALFHDVWTSRALGVLRIVVAFLFLQHPSAKFLHVPHVAYFDQLQVFSLVGIAGIIETIGGILLLIGLYARPAAFILCGEMAFAYFIGHAPKGWAISPMMNDGEAAVLYCFVFLFIAVAGAGAWSLDAMRSARTAVPG